MNLACWSISPASPRSGVGESRGRRVEGAGRVAAVHRFAGFAGSGADPVPGEACHAFDAPRFIGFADLSGFFGVV